MNSLKSHHLEDLRNSGLNDKTIAEGGFTSLTAEQTKTILGFEAGPGLGFEYPSLNGEPSFTRVKPDKPSKDKKGRPAKYLTPRGAGNHLYILPFVQEVLKTPTFPILITEGEKKAAKAVQEGYYCIALHCLGCGVSDRAKGIGSDLFLTWTSSNGADASYIYVSIRTWPKMKMFYMLNRYLLGKWSNEAQT